MILTGKAKQDFEEWLCRPKDPQHLKHIHIDLFYCKSHLERYAYYIEWLDSLGIYVNLSWSFDCFSYGVSVGEDRCLDYHFAQSRKQATEAAIKLANEIYNNQ